MVSLLAFLLVEYLGVELAIEPAVESDPLRGPIYDPAEEFEESMTA